LCTDCARSDGRSAVSRGAAVDEPHGRGYKEQRECEQPATFDPLKRPESSLGLVDRQLRVAVLDEVLDGVCLAGAARQ